MEQNNNSLKIILFLMMISFVFTYCKQGLKTETVYFYNGKIKFTGTFYKPLTAAPYPVIVLAHGSGKGDRSSFYYTPYGEYFSKNGIAVLIFDKRGTGDSEGIYDENPDFYLLAADLQEAFKYVISRQDVNKSKAGMLGISQAAWVLPFALQKTEQVAFAVCTSCPSVPPYQSDLFQKGREFLEEGYSTGDVNNILHYNRTVTEYVASLEGRDKVLQLKKDFKDQPWFKKLKYNPELSPEDTLKTPQYDHYRKSVFDPIPYWKNILVPTLFVFGEKDSHIPVQESINKIKESLNLENNFQIKSFNNTGHLLQTVNEPVESLKFNVLMFLKGKPTPIPEYFDFVKNWILDSER